MAEERDESDGGETGKIPTEEEIDEIAEEMTEGYLRFLSRVLGQDFVSDTPDEDMNEAQQKVRSFLSGWYSLIDRNPTEEERVEYLLQYYNEMAGGLLDEEDSSDSPFQQFGAIYSKVDETLCGVKAAHDDVGYPEYFVEAEAIADDLLNSGRHDEVLNTIQEIIVEKEGEILLQQIMSRFDNDFEKVLNVGEITENEDARELLRIYERHCELYKKLIPYLLFAVDKLNGRNPDIENLVGKRLDTLLQMTRGKKRERIGGFTGPIDSDLRNGIAHDEFVIDPLDNTVEVSDRGETVAEIDFQELHDLVLETLCLTQTLFLLSTIIQNRQNMETLEEIGNEKFVK